MVTGQYWIYFIEFHITYKAKVSPQVRKLQGDTVCYISSIISCLGGSHNNLVLRQTLMPTTSVKATEGRRTVCLKGHCLTDYLTLNLSKARETSREFLRVSL